jgi:HSP20 family protein
MNLLKRIIGEENPTELAKPGGAILSDFRREIDRAIDRVWRDVGRDRWPDFDVAPWPPVDVAEDDKALTLRVDVPGLEPKDVDVEVSGDVLTIRGSREEEQRTNGNGGPYRHERYTGSFTRAMTLPPYADADKVAAAYDKGVLTITIPKVPGQGPRKVPVRPPTPSTATK